MWNFLTVASYRLTEYSFDIEVVEMNEGSVGRSVFVTAVLFLAASSICAQIAPPRLNQMRALRWQW